LFGADTGIGETVRLGRIFFSVVGTLMQLGVFGCVRDEDDDGMVQLDSSRFGLIVAVSVAPGAVMDVSLTVSHPDDLAYVQGEVESLLRQRHRIDPGAPDDFQVRNVSQLVATRNETTRQMSWLLGAVATISLIVGGIGIMNIMLVSVTERIKEIGLRLAVGAGPSDVRRQFLAEAMLLSLGGGLLGILFGISGALLVGHFNTDLPIQLNGKVITLAAAFSVATGLFFGYYPA